MLQIGNVGLTIDEQHSHMALWCVSGAPLLVGTDLIHPSNVTLAILTNPEVIAVNQDLGWKHQVWAKQLVDGNWGVVLLNLHDEKVLDVKVQWSDLGINSGASVRDIWGQMDIGHFERSFTASNLSPHASAFIYVVADDLSQDMVHHNMSLQT
ncbi:MAG: hypothetical protein SGARI_004122 [Bacillariaceae sp.]